MNAHPFPDRRPGSDHEPVNLPNLPFNIEAEQALLGALLLNNDIADRLSGLDAEHFYDPVHGRIYSLAMRRIADGNRVDPVVLKSLLAEDAGLAELGGTIYLANMAGAAISIVAAPDYAATIVDLARRRRQIVALSEAIAALPTAEDPDDVIAALEAALSADDDAGARQSGVSLARAMEDALDGMSLAFQGGEPPGISLGIPALEQVIGRARPGDYILLAGRPSMGKSAVAVEIARRVACRAPPSSTGATRWRRSTTPNGS